MPAITLRFDLNQILQALLSLIFIHQISFTRRRVVMKKTLIALAVGASLLSGLVHAEEGDWVVRLRATNISPQEDSKLRSQSEKGLSGGALPGSAVSDYIYGDGNNAKLSVDSNTIPELDISYYITKNLATELILATGTRHDVSIKGLGTDPHANNANLGSVNLLPPTLTLQWHFLPDQTFDPYVGAGVTYVRAFDRNLSTTLDASDLPGGTGLTSVKLPIHISRNAFGPAIQAGFDVNLPEKWLLNFDVKKIWFDTKVTVDTSNTTPLTGLSGWKKIDQLDIDPWVISVGFGKKF
jgi:outer membrane protein